MMILRFRNTEDHDEMLRKVKKMKRFTEELEDCLESAVDDQDYKTYYHKKYDEDDDMYRSRYSFPRR